VRRQSPVGLLSFDHAINSDFETLSCGPIRRIASSLVGHKNKVLSPLHQPFHEKAGRCQVICGWVSSYLMFSFARIAGVFEAGEAAVKAERSEFILSLDGRRSQP